MLSVVGSLSPRTPHRRAEQCCFTTPAYSASGAAGHSGQRSSQAVMVPAFRRSGRPLPSAIPRYGGCQEPCQPESKEHAQRHTVAKNFGSKRHVHTVSLT